MCAKILIIGFTSNYIFRRFYIWKSWKNGLNFFKCGLRTKNEIWFKILWWESKRFPFWPLLKGKNRTFYGFWWSLSIWVTWNLNCRRCSWSHFTKILKQCPLIYNFFKISGHMKAAKLSELPESSTVCKFQCCSIDFLGKIVSI